MTAIVGFERCAELRARIDRGEPLAVVVGSAGLTVEAFREAERGWLTRIGSETARGRLGLAQRYHATYLAARPELAAAAPPAASRGRVARAAPEVPPAILATSDALPVLALEILPFDEPAPGQGKPAPDPRRSLEYVAIEQRAYLAHALPFAAGASPKAPALAALDRTGVLAAWAPPEAPALPFAGRGVAPAPTHDPTAPRLTGGIDRTSEAQPALEDLTPPLALEAYAALCAAWRAAPERVAELERTYGVTVERAVLDARFREWFARFPEDHRAFIVAFEARLGLASRPAG
ncbi:MAG: hypothetical protein FJ096_01255 [Deltaproteobacteria bacterium]|nr:hypothetical protein [Deltaproteobacteria bacterium]